MKKEFIDYLYELRWMIQSEINRLVELNNSTVRDAKCKDCGDEIRTELNMRRIQIQSVNQTIEKYFETHTKNI